MFVKWSILVAVHTKTDKLLNKANWSRQPDEGLCPASIALLLLVTHRTQDREKPLRNWDKWPVLMGLIPSAGEGFRVN